jgi:hypothetical protein
MLNAIEASDIRRRHDLLREWMTEHKTNSYRREELPAHIVPPTNDETGALEVFEFMRDKPDRYFLYVKTAGLDIEGACVVTTWNGERLGAGTIGRVYRSNMGDKRRSIWFTAITGEKYSGTYFFGAGDYARVRKVRS